MATCSYNNTLTMTQISMLRKQGSVTCVLHVYHIWHTAHILDTHTCVHKINAKEDFSVLYRQVPTWSLINIHTLNAGFFFFLL